MFIINRFANINVCVYYNNGMGSTVAIIGFAIGPDLCSTQLLNHAIKTRPTVLGQYYPNTIYVVT